MDFQLIDQDLSESKLYRYTGNFARLSGRDNAD